MVERLLLECRALGSRPGPVVDTIMSQRCRPMSDGYKYDLFLSYKRAGDVPMWLTNHFYPLLTKAMENLLPAAPRIFLDTQQEIGVNWPNNLAYSLRRSSYMVAVWTVPYFYSPWCMAEWRSMLKREQL